MEVNYAVASLAVLCGQHIYAQAIFGFLDWNYRYKSVATHFSHYAGFNIVLYHLSKSPDHLIDRVVSVSDY